jgi:hypothetical protein
VVLLTIFHHPEEETFFLHKLSCQANHVCFRIMKNSQHQHKANPHTQEKSLSAATFLDDAITDRVGVSEIETSWICI